jgi:glyoxylate reductase
MRPKVYVTRRIPHPGLEIIGECCDILLHEGETPPSREEIIRNVRDKDGLLCLLTDSITEEVMDAGPRLKVISTFSTGFEHLDVPAATARGIYCGHTPDVLTEATADLTFALLLGAARNIVPADRFLRSGEWSIPWSPTLFLGEMVWGRTLGLVGFGRIGRAVALRAKGFNMKVLYHDMRRLSPDEERKYGAHYRTLEALLGESDFVSLHTPLTPQTRHLMNEERFGLMKAKAFLINASRGPVVDETALVKALKEGRIAGAALDVFEKEPVEKDNSLLGFGNVVLLPHIASATTETRSKMAEMSATNLVAALKGQRPPHLLNPEVEKIRTLSEIRMI